MRPVGFGVRGGVRTCCWGCRCATGLLRGCGTRGAVGGCWDVGTPVLLGSWDHPWRGAEEGAPEQGKGWGKAKQGESIQPPPPSCGEAPRGWGDGRSPFSPSPRLANKQDSATALLPCELIERLSLERLVNENRSPCRIVSGGVLFSPFPPTPFPTGADLAHPPTGALRCQPGSPRRSRSCHSAGAAMAPPHRPRHPGTTARSRSEGIPWLPACLQVGAGLSPCVSPCFPTPWGSSPSPHHVLTPPGTRRPPGRMTETVRGRRGSTGRCGPSAAFSPW